MWKTSSRGVAIGSWSEWHSIKSALKSHQRRTRIFFPRQHHLLRIGKKKRAVEARIFAARNPVGDPHPVFYPQAVIIQNNHVESDFSLIDRERFKQFPRNGDFIKLSGGTPRPPDPAVFRQIGIPVF